MLLFLEFQPAEPSTTSLIYGRGAEDGQVVGRAFLSQMAIRTSKWTPTYAMPCQACCQRVLPLDQPSLAPVRRPSENGRVLQTRWRVWLLSLWRGPHTVTFASSTAAYYLRQRLNLSQPTCLDDSFPWLSSPKTAPWLIMYFLVSIPIMFCPV